MRKGLLLVTFLALITTIAFAQTRKISGTVTGENGTVVAGASVTIKGTSKGTTTSSTGKFSIDVPSTGKRILVVNSIGYGAQEISITTQSDLTVKLVTDTKLLDDVVVVGYGAVKKKDLTGAVGSVKAVEIVRGNPANATQALQGQVPGVLVTKMSNKPGQLWQIAIRGENTITPNPNADGGVNLTYTSSTQQFQGTEPLVVIDGIIGGKLQDINPADIESMDMLKDASTTAIYG